MDKKNLKEFSIGYGGVKKVKIGGYNKLLFIGGPCAIESLEHSLKMASKIKKICDKLDIQYIFKSCYNKDSRSSPESFNGIGIEEGLKILLTVREKIKVPVVADFSDPAWAAPTAKVVDLLQIPAYLCRQTSILEAELIKLYSNANRYINFAIANQLFAICHLHNLNFDRIRNIMQDGYARNLNLTKAGLTSGPCLLKDTMQLKSFCNNSFELGTAAMKINEKIPNLIIEKLKNFKNYKNKTIGLIGLTFKGETDDIRDSLSIKLLNKLKKLKLNILQSDEFYTHKNNIKLKTLILKSNIIIIGAPHKKYLNLKIPKNKKLINIWGTDYN